MADHESRILWSPEAIDDVDQLWEYHAEVAGRAVADSNLREIMRTVATISDFPFAGRSRDELRPGFRSIAVGPHILFYKIINERPEIIRVLDGRRDLKSTFFGDE